MPSARKERSPRRKSEIKPGWYGLAAQGALLILIFFLVPALSDSSPWASALGYLPPLIYWLVATIITFTAVAMRRKYSWIHIAVWILIFPLYTGFIPRLPRAQPEKNTTLRVMTLNVLGDRCDIDALAEYIRKGNLDVIMLQESRLPNGDVTHELAEKLSGYKAFSAGETGILTRLETLKHRYRPIPAPYDRYIVRVTAKWKGQPVEFMTTHWTIPPFRGDMRKVLARIEQEDARRAEQIKETLQEVDLQANPVVLAGDFNTPRLHAQLHGLRSRMTNAWEAAGSGFGYTFSAKRPMTRIDHVWADDNWEVRRCIVGPSFGADHRSVVADLVLKNSKR